MLRIWLLQRCITSITTTYSNSSGIPTSSIPHDDDGNTSNDKHDDDRRRQRQDDDRIYPVDNDTHRQRAPLQSYLRLPDASKPWREACYRMAGCLINMAEKCVECAIECASSSSSSSYSSYLGVHLEKNEDGDDNTDDNNDDDELMWILMESWGGVGVYDQQCPEGQDDEHGNMKGGKSKSKGIIPILHLGLANILKQRIASSESRTTTTNSIAAGSKDDGHEMLAQERCRDDDNGININIQGQRLQGRQDGAAPVERHCDDSSGSSSIVHHRSSRTQRRQRLEKTIRYILDREKERKRRAREKERIRKICQKPKS